MAEEFLLEKGARYRGTILVDALGLAPTSVVKNAFENLGFVDVQIWPESPPADWPDEDKEEPAKLMSVFWAEGTWDGEDNTPIITSGDDWYLYRIRKIEDAPGEPDQPDQPGGEVFEQDVPQSKFWWVPPLAVSLTNSLAVWLWIRAGEENS
jgi:hypothetical protein